MQLFDGERGHLLQIAEYLFVAQGKTVEYLSLIHISQGDPCIMNLWVHDGSKDITVNRMKYRALLVTTANIKRKEPSCTRSLLFLVISATREE